MKVVCTDGFNAPLTTGKVYDIIRKVGSDSYLILDDNGEKKSYFTFRFEKHNKEEKNVHTPKIT